MICVILRKAYGLGIQSLVGGSFKKPSIFAHGQVLNLGLWETKEQLN